MKKIGEGSFGKVFEVDQNKIAKYSVMDESAIHVYTLRELCFLSQYTHPYIIQMIDNYTTKNHKVIEMHHGGKDLHNWVKTISRQTLAKYLPSIIYQLLTALSYLENNGFTHGDLKPSNITIIEKDGNVDIKIIDWGSINFLPKIKIFNTCTYNFSAPELLDLQIILNPRSLFSRNYVGSLGKFNIKNDIFSLGLIIKFLLSKTIYKPYDIYKYNFECYMPFLDTTTEWCTSELDPEIIEICQKMLHSDPATRPTAIELWNEKYFDKFRLDSKFYKDIEKTNTDDRIDNYDDKYKFSIEKRNEVIEWAFKAVSYIKKLYLFTLGIWIFDKFLSLCKEEINDDDLHIIIATCMKTADIILYCYTHDISFWLKRLPGKYGKNQFNKVTNYVVKTINYNIFRKTFDMFIKNPDYNHVLKICQSKDYNKMDKTQKIEMYEAMVDLANKDDKA